MDEKITTGQIVKVSTTADQCVRLTVDVPAETCPSSIIAWKNKAVALALLPEGGE